MRTTVFTFLFFVYVLCVNAFNYRFDCYDKRDNLYVKWDITYDDTDPCLVHINRYVDKSMDKINNIIKREANVTEEDIEQFSFALISSKKVVALESFKGKINIPSDIRKKFNDKALLFIEDADKFVVLEVSDGLGYFTKVYCPRIHPTAIFDGLGNKVSYLNFERLYNNLFHPDKIGEAYSLSKEYESSGMNGKYTSLHDYTHKVFGFKHPSFVASDFNRGQLLSVLRSYWNDIEEKEVVQDGMKETQYEAHRVPDKFMDQMIDWTCLCISADGKMSWTYFFDFKKNSQANRFMKNLELAFQCMGYKIESDKYGHHVYSMKPISGFKKGSLIFHKFKQLDHFVVFVGTHLEK